MGPVPPVGDDGKKYCNAITEFTHYYTSEYGRVADAVNIKKEIMARGPIACSVYVTPKFHAYKGGVYYEKVETTHTNHVVSLVGWGVDESTNTEYWMLRNSWGAYWGEDGFMRIEANKNTLNIEKHCVWGVPSYSKSSKK